MDTLPVVRDGGSNRFFIDEMGLPIWPVSTQPEMDLLALTAGRVGSALRLLRSDDAYPRVAHGHGVTVSFEPNIWSEGRLYAHLTKREFRGLRDAQRLSEIEDLEIVVCSSEAITSELLHRIYDPVRSVSPGLIYGTTPDELRAQVLRASALAQLKTRAEGTYVQICPDLGTGSAAERSWVTNAVALDASVLAVLTHSDALDAPLSAGHGRGNLLICPIRNPLPVAPHRTPECRHSGWCYRVRMSVEDAFARGELIEPREFRARVLVWSTCFGLIHSAAPLDRQWSVVHHFYMNPNIDVVVTKWRGAFGHGPFSEMVQNLAVGATVGEAVAAFNATEGILERGAQFAILGDPRIAAPFSEVHPGVEQFYLSSRSMRENLSDPRPAGVSSDAGPVDKSVALLRDCLTTPLRYSDEQRDAAAARNQFEQAYALFQRDSTNSKYLAAFQGATLECLRRYADVIHGWSPRVLDQKFSIGTRCVHCGELKTNALNVFATAWEPRRVGTCPRCQIVEDSPADFDLDFRVTERQQLELVGTIPEGHFSGLVVLWSTRPMAGTVRRWPVASDGSPLRRIDLDVEWPRGTARVTVWMMFDLQYLTLNHRVPGRQAAGS
jgi:hypothetical protein